MSSFLLGVLGGGGPGGCGSGCLGLFPRFWFLSASGVAFGHHQQAILLAFCTFRRLYEVQLQVFMCCLVPAFSNSISEIYLLCVVLVSAFSNSIS